MTYSDAELERLLDEIESDRTERKQAATDGDRIRQVICAFANDLPNHRTPGILFVGVDDKGKPIGLSITDQMLQNLASMRDDGMIIPFPSLDVQRRTLKGQDVAVVFVHPSSAPPVRFHGAVWIRTGPRRGVANADDERRLNEKRQYQDLPADIRPNLGADMSALDEQLFRSTYLPYAVARDVMQQNQRSLEHQFVAAKFAQLGPPTRPTMLGLLTVGRSPTDWIAGAYIQYVHFDGKQLTDPVKNQREIRGPLPHLLQEMDDLIKNSIQSSADFTNGPTEVRTADYPIVALQQITRNAVLHRTYENTHAPVRIYWFNDRVEIQNPGGPFGQVTKETFGKPGFNDYRNPNLAGVMKELGYVQRFGVGIELARREMAKNGNPPPEFQVEDSHVAVILRSRA